MSSEEQRGEDYKEVDDSPPQLSQHALAALQEFYDERLVQEQQSTAGAGPQHVEEDWQLSQFWYDETTSQVLAEEALQDSQNKRIACISCPTLFSKLMALKPPGCHVILLEYDCRFEMHGSNFVFYDYNEPLTLPETLQKETYDLVIADPPFLSEECLQKTAETIKFLAKEKILLCTGTTRLISAMLQNHLQPSVGGLTSFPDHAEFFFSSVAWEQGAVMEDMAFQLLGVKPCQFVPKHTRNLANEFRCYANYKTGFRVETQHDDT